MKLIRPIGSTDQFVEFFANDNSVVTGAGFSGLSATTASVTAYYYRSGDSVTTQIPLTNSSLGVHEDGGLVAVDGTNMIGLYQLALPDAVFATGATSVIVQIDGVSTMGPVLLEIQLSDLDLNDSVRAGLTALPNAAAGGSGGLPTGDSTGAVTVSSVTSDGVDTIWAKEVSSTGIFTGSGIEAPGTSIFTAMNALFILGTYKRTQDGTTENVYSSDGSTLIAVTTKSDDGSTFTRNQYAWNDGTWLPPPPLF